MSLRAWRGLVLLPLMLGACGQVRLDGIVTDASGEALPGVVVKTDPAGGQDLTDVRGRYNVRIRAGSTVLLYSKSGYAPGRLEVTANPAGGHRVRDVALWRLPLNPGVYLVDNYRYDSADWVVPKQYFLKEGTLVYGTDTAPKAFTHSPIPFIVCYHTPRYDARLSRLIEAEATRPASKSSTFSVWVPAGTVAVSLRPVDTPEEHLLHVELDRPLEPGAYAVHWGALDGYTTLDNRVFLFKVLEPQEGPLPDLEPEEPLAQQPSPQKPGEAP